MEKSEWVIGKYTGDRAKSVKAHADAGVGYFVREESGKRTSYTVEVAFRRIIDDEPLPDHLTKANYTQTTKLEELRFKRLGIPKERQE